MSTRPDSDSPHVDTRNAIATCPTHGMMEQMAPKLATLLSSMSRKAPHQRAFPTTGDLTLDIQRAIDHKFLKRSIAQYY